VVQAYLGIAVKSAHLRRSRWPRRAGRWRASSSSRRRSLRSNDPTGCSKYRSANSNSQRGAIRVCKSGGKILRRDAAGDATARRGSCTQLRAGRGAGVGLRAAVCDQMARSKKGGGGSHLMAAGAAGLALAIGYFALGGGTAGCTDASALNFAPAATVDDGTCVGSMYDLGGVFEFQTVAPATAKQAIVAIEMEFDFNKAQQMAVITKVTGGTAAANGARAGDELLALKTTGSSGAPKTALISARGKTGVMDSIQHVMSAQPGSQLAWVLRHASAAGGIEDIDLTFEAATIEVMPPLAAWTAQQSQAVDEWADGDGKQAVVASRDDLHWCGSDTNPRHETLNGWYTLLTLSDDLEHGIPSIIQTKVGFQHNNQGEVEFDLRADVSVDTIRGYNRTVVSAIIHPSSSSDAQAYKGISVGDEVLSIGGVQIARQGPDALAYALRHAAARGSSRSRGSAVWELKPKQSSAKPGNAATKTKVEQAFTLLADEKKTQLELKHARRAAQLMERAAAKRTGAVTLAEWAAFGSALHQW
jgi:hypothetical protein